MVRNQLPAQVVKRTVVVCYVFQADRYHCAATFSLLASIRPCFAEPARFSIVFEKSNSKELHQIRGPLFCHSFSIYTLNYMLGAPSGSSRLHRWKWDTPARECIQILRAYIHIFIMHNLHIDYNI